jgi:hypothetical protein
MSVQLIHVSLIAQFFIGVAITGFVLECRLIVKDGSESPPVFIFMTTTMYSIRIWLALKQLKACL